MKTGKGGGERIPENMKIFHWEVNSIRKDEINSTRKDTKKICQFIKSKRDKLMRSYEEVRSRWREYFNEDLNF